MNKKTISIFLIGLGIAAFFILTPSRHERCVANLRAEIKANPDFLGVFDDPRLNGLITALIDAECKKRIETVQE